VTENPEVTDIQDAEPEIESDEASESEMLVIQAASTAAPGYS
jgi:hypothetical protein